MSSSHSLTVIFVLLFFFLVYTAIVIWKEKKNYLKNRLTIQFHHFIFPIPPWWHREEINENNWLFKRVDSHYDWFCRFEYLPLNGSTSSDIEGRHLDLLLQLKLNQLQIVFDPDPLTFYREIKGPNSLWQLKRMEGTATEKEENRIYCDIVVLTQLNGSEMFFLINQSSVLSGIIEGPFFDQMLKDMHPHHL
jgi:hypothetical protein